MYFMTVILYNWRSFKYLLKVGVELENAPWISCLNLTSLFALFVFSLLLEFFLNEHPILYK
jgi:hypothetical protein